MNSARTTPKTENLFQPRGDELLLARPICGCSYTHVQRVWALEGSDAFEGRGEYGELYGIPVGGMTDSREVV
jgi:hypothetical protein